MFNLIKQTFKISLTALLANKARSFLTMLGIIIGVAAVIIIMAVGAGAQSLILSQVEGLGTNLIGVMPGKSEEDSPPAAAMGIVITTLTYEDVEALRQPGKAPDLTAVAGYSSGVATVSRGASSYDTNLTGTTASYLTVEKGELAGGRFFDSQEEKNLARVAVLGSVVKEELFGQLDALGQKIKIKQQSFEVIGVMAERGTVAFQDYDDQVFLPLKTMQKLIAGVNHLGLIRAKVNRQDKVASSINDIEMTLRERHDIRDNSGASDDFTVRSAAEALNVITTVTNALRYFLAAMAALSLIVGGVGIMNIMLVSVSQRTREIGLRKAVGADNSNILSQFLLEAVIITLLGGLIGILAGAAVSLLIAVGAKLLGYDWSYIISLLSVILALTVSTMVGLLFGLYPARKASGLEPVEALRYE